MDVEIKKVKTVLKDQLKRNRLTYEDVAKELEVSVPTIKRWMGDGELTLTDLHRISKLLKMSLTEIHLLAEKVEEQKKEEFSQEQQEFLAKHPHYFAYFLQLSENNTPEQIQEKFKLTKSSTDKYLVKLEQKELIRVTTANKVKINFSEVPNLGYGILAKTYFQQFIKKVGDFFIEIISEEMWKKDHPALDKKDHSNHVKFGISPLKVRKETFESWHKQSAKLLKDLEMASKIEEKAYEDNDLMYAFVMDAHCLLPMDHKSIDKISEGFGKITNI